MITRRIAGCTRVLGKAQGYVGLPIRDVEVFDEATGALQYRAMESAWEPTPEELARLQAGAPIVLSVIGTAHPPVLLEVGAVPAESEE